MQSRHPIVFGVISIAFVCGRTEADIILDNPPIDVLDAFGPVGAANVSVSSDGLTISDIGPSGADGAALDVRDATNGLGAVVWSATLPAGPDALEDGSSLRHAVTGVRDGRDTLSPLEIRRIGDELHFFAHFTPGDRMTIEVLDASGNVTLSMADVAGSDAQGNFVPLPFRGIAPPRGSSLPQAPTSLAGSRRTRRRWWTS